MKRLLTVTLVLFSFSPLLVRGQIVGNCTAPYDNATELVNLLVNGVPFSNATLTGFDCSAGYFDGSTSNLSLESGLVMATGGVESIEPGAFGGALGGPGVDADLTEQLVMVGASATNLNNLIVLNLILFQTQIKLLFNMFLPQMSILVIPVLSLMIFLVSFYQDLALLGLLVTEL